MLNFVVEISAKAYQEKKTLVIEFYEWVIARTGIQSFMLGTRAKKHIAQNGQLITTDFKLIPELQCS